MKRIVPLLPALLVSTLLSAQSYFPTSNENPIWTIRSQSMGDTSLQTVKVSVGPDTLLCENIWSKVIYDNIEHDIQSLIGYYPVENEKVYFRHNTSCNEPEYLLYDFGAEVGDLVPVGINPYLFPTDIAYCDIYNVDTLLYGGIPRKKLDFIWGVTDGINNFFYTSSWVQGIGDLNDPFPIPGCYDYCEGGGSIACLTLHDSLVYANNFADICQYDLTRIYVDSSQISPVSDRDGSSWEDAFLDLQDALAIADYGDTIWVAQGTYYPTDDNDREKYFEMKNGVAIYGGFNGTETSLEQRDFLVYETILSGDIGIIEDSTDNSYHVLYLVDCDSTTSLDGFTITHGYAIHESPSYYGHFLWGGAIFIGAEDSLIVNPRIENCSFKNNTARNGGAIYCNGNNNKAVIPSFKDCFFKHNQSNGSGGAIFHKNGALENADFNIEDCIFMENNASHEGGAIRLSQVRYKTTFNNCTFLKNNAISDGGGIYFNGSPGDAQLDINNCDFRENTAASGGGISFLYTGFTSDDSHQFQFNILSSEFYNNESENNLGGALAIQNNGNICEVSISFSTFEQNRSINGGGAIYTISDPKTNLIISHCRFTNNQTNVGAGGAIFSKTYFNPIANNLSVSNSVFVNNEGAIVYLGGTGEAKGFINNCTFFNNGGYSILKNWSPDFDYLSFYNRTKISNSVIWEPSLPLGRILYNNNPDNHSIHDYEINNTLISTNNCDLPGGDTACGEGIIFNQNPIFLDTMLLDLRLAACSPAVNAGLNPDSLLSTTDLGEQARILEDVIDIGAYERNSFDLQIEEIINASCYESQDAQVSFTIEGDEPYEYSWTRDSILGEGNDQLAAGEYLFTITDINDCSDTLSLTITEPEPIIGQYTINHASTPNTSDGSIILDELTGGIPPYEFSWNNGDTTASLINIPPGEYVLSVLDSNGCEQVYEFELSFISSTNQMEPSLDISLYPNPANDQITLSFTKPLSEYSLWVLYNNLGQVVLSKELSPLKREYQLAIDHILPGLYFGGVLTKEEFILGGKIIISK